MRGCSGQRTPLRTSRIVSSQGFLLEYRVTKCICTDTSFREWLSIKRSGGHSLAQMACITGCGEGCGMCRPYLAVVARTGVTSLPPLLPEDDVGSYDDEE